MSETITTVIPTFQRPKLLARAIKSILAQTYRDCSVLVLDNASADETASVVAQMAAQDPRVRYHRQPTNLGALANFSYGMSSVRTPFFSLLSDDDVLFPEFYADAIESLQRYPQALMFAGSTLEYDEEGRLGYVPLSFWPREGLYEPDEALRRMLGFKHPTWTGIVFRCSALELAGPLDPEVGPPADVDFEMRVAARAPMIVSFKPCAAWVSHPNSVNAGVDAGVVRGYEKMARNIEAVDALAAGTKKAMVAGLHRVAVMKLLEIGVKAQVRRDAAAARAAAKTLRERYRQRVLAASLLALSSLCANVAPAQAALRWLESIRLRMRAASARRRTHASAPELERYARYLRMS